MQPMMMYSDGEIYLHHSYNENPRNLINSGEANYGMHAHENFELYCFLRGDCSYIVEGNEYKLRPGNIMIMRPAEVHCLKVEGNTGYERIALNFPQRIIEGLDPKKILLEPYYNRPLGKFNQYDSGEFSKYLIRMVSLEEGSSSYEQRLAIITNILPLLSEIREAFQIKIAEGSSRLNDSSGSEIIDYINRNLAGDLSLETLADIFFISKSQLNRRFKRLTGATVGEYVTAKRLLCAREMIFSGAPAARTSRECGFNDYSTFYRAYRKKFGVSPVRTGGTGQIDTEGQSI